ncbi:DUF6049 family protein [Actinomadura keratinilytica]|uniref:DUF6049 family protein n=1 Tax=Actinomadura keratinilytica TaxID=547461 RepID=A0ABP7Y4X5_9ACTN
MRTVKRAAWLAVLVSCVSAVTAPALAATPRAPKTAQSSPNRPQNPVTAQGAAQAQGASQAQAASQQAGRQQSQVTLALSKVTPSAITASGKNSRFTLTGTVRNNSGHTLAGLSVRLRYSSHRITSRGELAQYASAAPSRLPGATTPRPLPQAAAANGTQTWKLGGNAAAVGMRQFGVYPVGVEVINSSQQVLAGFTTFLTFTGNAGGTQPLSVAWVWPLIDGQHRANDSTFIDNRLATDLARGRLSTLVDAAAATTTPITWAIDPALLDDVQAMNQTYLVKRPGTADKGTRTPANPAARQWIDKLKRASKGDPYFVLPYADPDAVALVRYGDSMARHLDIAYKNTAVAAEVLGRAPTVKVAWPPSGMAGPDTLDALSRYGQIGTDGAFLLSNSAFQENPQGYTTSATTAVQTKQGMRRVLTYDDTINDIVSSGTRSPGAAALAEQRFLAETAMITAEAPNLRRTLIVVPDRHWNPAPEFAQRILAHTKSAPWLKAVDLQTAIKAKPQARVFTGYPDAYEAYELGPAYLEQVRRIARDVALFSQVTAEPVRIDYTRAVLRMESAAWRGHGRRARAAREELARELGAHKAGVKIIPSQNALAGSSGRILVSVANNLRDQNIKVRLEVTSENSAKLQIGRFPAEDLVLELGPGEKVSRKIPVQAAGNGNFRVRLRLITAEGRVFGTEEITVRTTGYGRLALLITGGSLAVLFVGVGVRAMRARRRRKAEAGGDGSTGAEPAPIGAMAPASGDPGPPDVPGAGAGSASPARDGHLPGNPPTFTGNP